MKEKAAANSTNPSIPAKAGISAAKPHSPIGDHCNVPLSRNFPLTREEIPAFAGMERGGEWKKRREWKCEGGGNGSAGEAGIEVWRGRE